MPIRIPTHPTDSGLIADLMRCARAEREATATFIARLAELDARQLHLAAGFSSLFAYCLQVLRLSESATCKRIDVARAARRYPRLLERIADGGLSLTIARLYESALFYGPWARSRGGPSSTRATTGRLSPDDSTGRAAG